MNNFAKSKSDLNKLKQNASHNIIKFGFMGKAFCMEHTKIIVDESIRFMYFTIQQRRPDIHAYNYIIIETCTLIFTIFI